MNHTIILFLLKLKPKLVFVHAFGTDGEQALTKAILA
jgi:hypothetical protein